MAGEVPLRPMTMVEFSVSAKMCPRNPSVSQPKSSVCSVVSIERALRDRRDIRN
jgi:hypothetical protein